MPRSVFFALSLLIAAPAAVSQSGITGHPGWVVKPAYNRGIIMVHRISIGHLVKGYPAIYELNIGKPTLGNKLWHHENNFPEVGVTMQCMDYMNREQLGYALTAAPYIEIPLNRNERASRLVMRLSWGATYLTKRFHIHENHKNIAIGSHWNSFVQFRWLWQLPLGSNLRFEPGFTFSHASNGRARNPNLGLNVVSLHAGLNFRIRANNVAKAHPPADSSTKVRSRNELLFIASYGNNERQLNRPNLNVTTVSLAYQRNVRNTHKFAAGADVFFDENYMQDFENERGRYPKGPEKARVALKLGYSYNVGRVSFPFETGYYVYQLAGPDGYLVSRLGVRYYSACGLVAHFGLRSHFAVAYNFEFGLGYRLYLR